MKPSGFEGCDPNYGLCADAMDVLSWQALASTQPTQIREAAKVRADGILNECGRCDRGSMLRGDPTKTCKMAGLAIEFTSLGPDINDPPLYGGPYAQDRIS